MKKRRQKTGNGRPSARVVLVPVPDPEKATEKVDYGEYDLPDPAVDRENTILPSLRKKQRAFLAAYAHTGNITRAAKFANVSRIIHHNHWMKDPAYVEAFRAADLEAGQRMEEEADRRAVEGLRRYKFDGMGNPIIDPRTGEQYFEHVYSDTLLIFRLKARFPDKYRENRYVEHKGRVEHSGEVTHVVIPCLSKLSVETRRRMLADLAAAGVPEDGRLVLDHVPAVPDRVTEEAAHGAQEAEQGVERRGRAGPQQ